MLLNRSGLHTRISILAPARGATISFISTPPLLEISILAPARGATNPRSISSTVSAHFNPRSREGSDLSRRTKLRAFPQISILAPARGATRLKIVRYGIVEFQSSLPRGERQLRLIKTRPRAGFQSSLPRGERPNSIRSLFDPGKKFQSSLPRGERRRRSPASARSLPDFNPRSREGSDDGYASGAAPVL